MKRLVIGLAGFLATVMLVSGCASATPQYDTQGNIVSITGYGFLRDLEVEQKKPDGSYVKISTRSTSGDVIKATNEVLGTLVDGAGKAMP